MTSNANLCIIRVLFQIKSFAILIKRASLFFYEILHIEDSFSLIKILNQKYAILPLLIRSIAILKKTTVTAIFLHDLTFTSKVLYRNILSVLPNLSIKKNPELCLIIYIIA